MRTPLLIKVTFWLILIGFAALMAPNPAWPEWVARMILSAGIALGITTVGVAIFSKRKQGK